MSFCTRFLFCFGVIQLMLSLYNMNAYCAESKKKCAPGCFCIYDGVIPEGIGTTNICGHGTSQRLSCDGTNKVYSFTGGIGNEGVLACVRDNASGASIVYYFDEFSELYTGTTGMYGFIGDDLIVMPVTGPSSTFGAVGMFQCPSSHPSSAAGAKTPYECYTHDAKGNKVYFTATASSDVKVLAASLQNLLNEATQIAKDLQRLTIDNTESVTVNTNKFDKTKEVKLNTSGGTIRKSTAVNTKFKAKILTNKSAVAY